MDIDGRDIIINYGTGESVKYKPGMELPDDNFARKTIQMLNAIHGTELGAEVVNSLATSNRSYYISETNNVLETSFNLGKSGEKDRIFFSLTKDKKYSEANELLINSCENQIELAVDGYAVGWDNKNLDFVKMNATLALGHELYHAYQFDKGAESGRFLGLLTYKDGDVLSAEIQGVGFENYLRGTLFPDTKYDDTRAYYSLDPIDRFFEPTDWWDYFLGWDKLDPDAFQPGTDTYQYYKNELDKKAENESIKLLQGNPDENKIRG